MHHIGEKVHIQQGEPSGQKEEHAAEHAAGHAAGHAMREFRDAA